MRDVCEDEFNAKLDKGTAKIHLYRGRKSNEIKEHVKQHLATEKTDSVIVVGGGNDLSSSRSPETVAETLVNIGVDCMNAGVPVEKIRISSILPREDAHQQGKRKKINDLLQQECKKRNFMFIANSNIVFSRHIRRDGVHLNKVGTEKLANNFLDVLNNSNNNNIIRVEDCSAMSIMHVIMAF